MSRAGKAVIVAITVAAAIFGCVAIYLGFEARAARTKAIYYSILNRAYLCGVRDGQIAIMSRLPALFESTDPLLKNNNSECAKIRERNAGWDGISGNLPTETLPSQGKLIENIEKK